MKIDVTYHKSRKQKGWAPYCVDTRGVVENGKQAYFDTKLEANAYADRLGQEVTMDTSDAWDWTFEDLLGFNKDDEPVGHFVKELQKQYDRGELSRSNHIEKNRAAKVLLSFQLNNKSLAKFKVRELTAAHATYQVMEQLRVGRSIKTAKNYLSSFRLFMRHAIVCGCRKTDPFALTKAKGDAKPSRFSGNAKRIQTPIIDKIISHMAEGWALKAEFAATTGLRQGEQRALLWSDLDLENGRVSVVKAVKHRGEVGNPKTPKAVRTLPLTPKMKTKLQELYLQSGRPALDSLVFPSTTGHILSCSRFLVAIHKACDAAGVERIRWHDLRHYYASQILQAFNNDLWTVTNLMGHESSKTTETIYGHWLDNKEKNDEIANKIAEIF